MQRRRGEEGGGRRGGETERAHTFPAASLPTAAPPGSNLLVREAEGEDGRARQLRVPVISAKQEKHSEQAFHGHNRNLLLMRGRERDFTDKTFPSLLLSSLHNGQTRTAH